jgi:hypothetical protein
VHASTNVIAAVGGFLSGVVLESDGTTWRDVTPPGAEQVIGVCLEGTHGYAVGTSGSVLRRDSDGWHQENTGLHVFRDLHATWIDPDGGVWAVGGQVVTLPLVDGVMVHRGAHVEGGLQ